MALDKKQFVQDLVEARKIGEEAAKGDDGGSANLDSVFLEVPRLKEETVICLIKSAGLSTWGRTSCFRMTGYMIYPPGGQGNSRARAAEAMTKHLRNKGYHALTYCKMD
jgi:hypothetical protein